MDATEQRILDETLDWIGVPEDERDERAIALAKKSSRYQRALLNARCVEIGNSLAGEFKKTTDAIRRIFAFR